VGVVAPARVVGRQVAVGQPVAVVVVVAVARCLPVVPAGRCQVAVAQVVPAQEVVAAQRERWAVVATRVVVVVVVRPGVARSG
jgi:hypothetical protein